MTVNHGLRITIGFLLVAPTTAVPTRHVTANYTSLDPRDSSSKHIDYDEANFGDRLTIFKTWVGGAKKLGSDGAPLVANPKPEMQTVMSKILTSVYKDNMKD